MRALIPLYFVAVEEFMGSLSGDGFATPFLRLGSLDDLSVGVLMGLLVSSSPTSCMQIS